MLSELLQLQETGPLSYLHLFLRSQWAGLLGLLVVALAVGYAVLLYRRERTLTAGRRLALGLLRAIALAVVVILLLEPVLGFEMTVSLPRTVLILVDQSESMGLQDNRTKENDVREAALALGKVPFANAVMPIPESARSDLASVKRIELARAILSHEEAGVFDRLAESCKVRYFGFGERLEPAAGEGETLPDSLRHAEPSAKATRLGSAIEEAVSRYSGQSIAGVILLTDGASNQGLEPLAVARGMLDKNIPIYPIGLGVPAPNDIRLEGLIAQDTVFHQDRVPVRVQFSATGFTNRTANLTVTFDGRKVAGKVVRFTGRPQFEELTFVPERERGSANLEVAISPFAEEATGANNRLSKSVRVIGDKIKVLYVEGKPRWEYRYLRRVLLRDHRLDVKFLLTEGDRDLAVASDEYLDDFPEEAARAFHFDLVILGDVPASFFGHGQLTRIEELVREHGGSFLMLAGREHAPGSYAGTPIESILPVRLEGGNRDVAEETHPVITTTGFESPVTSLEMSREKNDEIWALVKPLYKVPRLDGAKPAATVLAELSRGAASREEYPIIAWQRYGSGKSLYVGTDQLWRLRFKRGDKYHARFWGQAIQFLTLSRLLGENKRIRLETDRRDYRTGERIRISANVLNESFEPVKAPAFTVQVEQVSPAREQRSMRLEPVPDIAGLYQGAFTPEQAGDYRLTVEAADRPMANEVEFHVAASPLEQLEPALQEDLLQKMAELSGGKYFRISDLPKLPETVAGEARTVVVRREKDLWDLPIVLVLVVGLLGAEWLMRRRYDLI